MDNSVTSLVNFSISDNLYDNCFILYAFTYKSNK